MAGIDKTTSAETTGGSLKDTDIFRYSEFNGIGYDSKQHTMLSLKNYVVAGITIATTLAAGNNGNNLAITNLNSLAVTTITEQTSGAGIQLLTDQGAIVIGGANASMSIADDTEQFFLTAHGGIIFNSNGGALFKGGALTAEGGLKANEIQEIAAGDGITFRISQGNFTFVGDAIEFTLNDPAETASLTANNGFSITGNTGITGSVVCSTTIKTGNPGSGAGTIRLGSVQTAVTTLDGTRYWEVMIDGVAEKILLGT